jgi:Domain of unknown function (DUF4286)
MIIYNVTTKVSRSIHDAWLAWLKDEHIADIINTGCFTQAVILHLLESDDDEGITYAVQYHATDKVLYEQYLEQFAGEMRKKAQDKWGDQFISFRTIMRVVN